MHLSRRRTDMQMIRTHPQKAARRILPPTGGQNPKKAFPASARRIALQNAAANADRNRSISVPAWSPLTVTASVSQKRTACRCQQTPVPGRHRRCRSSRNAGAPAACWLILPRTARAVRLFCGELLSVRKKHPGSGRRRSADRAHSREPEPRPLSPSYYTRFRRCRQVWIEKNAQKGRFVLKSA